MCDLLPQKILREILSRLPLKALLQCRSVSKTWHSLITKPSFIAHHLTKTASRNPQLLLFRYNTQVGRKEEGRYLLYQDEFFPDDPVEELDCPFKGLLDFVNIVGSCNGVVCLSDDLYGIYTGRPALWNPSVRKIVTIPCPLVSKETHGAFALSHGFGFDSATDDYKLVRVSYMESSEDEFDVIPPYVEIYSLRSKSWRLVHNDLKYQICECTNGAFLNGACHWIASRQDENGGLRMVIVSFSLREELFLEMEIPNCLVKETSFLDVAVFNGSLLLVYFEKVSGEEESFSVWMMEEYGIAGSWTKLFGFSRLERIQKLVGFKQNGIVVLAKESGQLVLHDRNTRIIWNTGIVGTVESFYLDTYVESLVLLGESNESLEEDAYSEADSM